MTRSRCNVEGKVRCLVSREETIANPVSLLPSLKENPTAAPIHPTESTLVEQQWDGCSLSDPKARNEQVSELGNRRNARENNYWFLQIMMTS
jgi:hypothetical protein